MASIGWNCHFTSYMGVFNKKSKTTALDSSCSALGASLLMVRTTFGDGLSARELDQASQPRARAKQSIATARVSQAK